MQEGWQRSALACEAMDHLHTWIHIRTHDKLLLYPQRPVAPDCNAALCPLMSAHTSPAPHLLPPKDVSTHVPHLQCTQYAIHESATQLQGTQAVQQLTVQTGWRRHARQPVSNPRAGHMHRTHVIGLVISGGQAVQVGAVGALRAAAPESTAGIVCMCVVPAVCALLRSACCCLCCACAVLCRGGSCHCPALQFFWLMAHFAK